MREGYKKTEVGVIPEDWEVKKIGDLFDFKNGLNKEKEYFGKGTKIVNYVDVYRNRYVDDSIIKGLVEVTEKEKENFNTKKGDVFFTRTSETIDEIGMTSVLTEDIKDLVYSGFVLRARPKTDELDLNYKKYCFSDFYTRKEIMRKSSCTTRALTSGTLLKDVSIKVPPLKEQEKIAEILSTVDSQIDNTEKLIEKSKELKKGLMQKILTKGIGHSEFKKTEVGEIPVSWEVKKLEDISTVVMGQSPRSESYNEDKNGIPFFQGNSEFGRMYPTIKKWCNEPSKIAEPMDILISVRAPVGAVNLNKCKSCIGRGLAAVRSNDNSDYMYLYYILSYSEKVLNSSAQGSTFTAINSGDLKGLKIAMPKLEEQRNIGQILLSIDNEIEVYENKKQKLEEVKKGLMQQLLTGKIRVKI